MSNTEPPDTEQHIWGQALIKIGRWKRGVEECSTCGASRREVSPEYQSGHNFGDIPCPPLGNAEAVVAMLEWIPKQKLNLCVDCYGVGNWTVRIFDPQNEDCQIVDTAEGRDEHLMNLPLAVAHAVLAIPVEKSNA